MITRIGDMFTTEAGYIGHGVNCKGVMGRGIAKTVREQFPITYSSYRELCIREGLAAGDVQMVNENGVTVVNLATQTFPGPDARYGALFMSCMKAAQMITEQCKKDGRTPVLAIPQIGCGIGGLEWSKVETLLKSVEILNPGFQFEVWSL